MREATRGWRIISPSGIPIHGSMRDTPDDATADYALARGMSWPALHAKGYRVHRVTRRLAALPLTETANG
jgi:hypothetical protein